METRTALEEAAGAITPAEYEDPAAGAGTDGGGLFRSRNAGRAWRESGEGLPDSAVQCLAVSPSYDQDDEATVAQIGGRYEFRLTAN